MTQDVALSFLREAAIYAENRLRKLNRKENILVGAISRGDMVGLRFYWNGLSIEKTTYTNGLTSFLAYIETSLPDIFAELQGKDGL